MAGNLARAKSVNIQFSKKRVRSESNNSSFPEGVVLRGIISAIPQYILAKDRNKRFVWVSPGFCTFVNLKREDIIGKTDFDFFSEPLAKKYQADDEQILSGAVKRLEPQEEENVLKSGDPRYATRTVIRTKVPLIEQSGAIVGVLCTFQDISEQRRRRERMLKLFVHDTPRPLIVVRDTYLPEIEMVVETIKEDSCRELIKKNIAKIDDSIEFTLSCCHAYGLLGHSSAESWTDLNRCPVFYLSQLTQLVLSILKPNSHAKFFLDVPENSYVQSDKYKIVSILYCLIHNAITATRNLERPEIRIGIRIENGYLKMVVDDNGPGVDLSERQKIFDEGYSKFGSSGIGLYIVKRFAEEGDGVANVEDVNPEVRRGLSPLTSVGARFIVAVRKFTKIK